MREIALHRLAGTGSHPGIVRLNRIFEPKLLVEDGSLSLSSPYTFLVMDYAPCNDLLTVIVKAKPSSFVDRSSIHLSVIDVHVHLTVT